MQRFIPVFAKVDSVLFHSCRLPGRDLSSKADSAMFPFDQSQLPKVFSRKAFIGVHFQNDFTSEDGSLAATEPKGYVDRAVKLAAAFRACGNPVIWIKANLPDTPVPSDDRITATDSVSAIPSRGRRRAPGAEASSNSPPDEEAFLSHDEASCLKSDSSGSQLAPEIASEGGSSDIVITNTDYSAFTGTALLRLLRSKMVMEVFICGSLVNIGVHATAIEAAGHGMAITIVEDCCGYRNHGRQTISLSRLSHLTGCDMVSAKEVCDSLKPSTRSSAPTLGPTPNDKRAAGRSHNVENKPRSQSDQPSDLSDQLSKLQLEPDDAKLESQDRRTKVTVQSPISKQTAKSQDEPVLARPNSQTTSPASNDHASESASNSDTKAEENIKERPAHGDKEIDHSAAIEVDDGVTGDTPTNSHWEAQRGLCAGDTDVIDDVLPSELVDGIFEKLRGEVSWQRMSHQGGEVPRLVAVQGEVDEDGSMPVYRHPSDESPPLLQFTPTVRAIKAETEKHLGHELNHVLIQFYRDGNDYISEHSDKTIDVVKKSYIANVSLGAQRTMVLRTKRQDKQSSKCDVDQSAVVDEAKQPEESNTDPVPGTRSTNTNAERVQLTEAKEATTSRSPKTPESGCMGKNTVPSKREVQRATLRHNSLCRMGLDTNMQWLHSIRQDKRAERDKSDAELAFGGGRISLTFRRIGTFLNRDETKIWGQGATGKTKAEAKAVINGESPEMVALLKAFGRENHSSSFDWEEYYGKGFDVLHMSNAPRLFASRDVLINMRVALMLAEYGIGYAKGSMTASRTCNLDEDQLEAASIKFVDSDASKSVVQGDMAIMLYLNESYGTTKEATVLKPDLAKQFTHFQKALTVLTRWRRVQLSAPGKVPDLKLFKEELAFWDKLAATIASSESEETKFLSGSASGKPGLVDFALWPVLNDLVQKCGKDSLDGYADLEKWFKGFAGRDAVKSVAATQETK